MTTAFRGYLVLVFLANLGGMATLAIGLEEVMANYPRLDVGLVALLFVCGVTSLIALVLVWRWYRAGIYLITAAYAAMLVVNLYYQAPLAHTLLGPIGLAVLYGLIWPLRKRFSAEVES